MTDCLRVFVVGGRGYFGRRLVDRLMGVTGVEIYTGGRGEAEDGDHNYHRIDARRGDLTGLLRRLKIDVMVAATGPFAPGDYSLASTAIAAAVHYIDIADSRSHVSGITVLDERARAAGVLVTSGASSVPALSSAVVDHYAREFEHMEKIDYGISASELTPGTGAIESALAYCGRRIYSKATEHRRIFGWQDGSWQRFDQPLGWRWMVRCDVPDLDLFADRYPGCEVNFRAGVAPLPHMFGMWLLAWIVRSGMIASVASLAPVLQRLSRGLEWLGSGRSGMFVRIDGQGNDGLRIRREWQLIAWSNCGPFVPVVPAVALIRKLARGELPGVGAMPCMGLLTLEDLSAEFRDLNIRVTKKNAGISRRSIRASLALAYSKSAVLSCWFTRFNTSTNDRNSIAS